MRSWRMPGITAAARAAILAVAAGAAQADGERAGDFDYYVLALSWTPSWCAIEGDARDAERCDARGLGWSLHGLWPQYEDGWPSDCRTTARAPSRQDTAAQADLFGSGGAAWHQWRKHGTCSGLSARDFYALARLAYDRVERPAVLRQLDEAVRLPASVVEDAFLEADPALEPDGVTVTCRDRRVYEVRICLTRDLDPRACGRDARRDCGASDALLSPIR